MNEWMIWHAGWWQNTYFIHIMFLNTSHLWIAVKESKKERKMAKLIKTLEKERQQEVEEDSKQEESQSDKGNNFSISIVLSSPGLFGI